MNEQPSNQNTRFRGRRSGGWVGGAILVTLGILLLLQNMTDFHLDNWWALFILLPAVGAFTAAGRNYQEAGRVTAGVRASLMGGVALVAVSAIFLFSLDWAVFGPILLVLAGVSLLLNGLLPN